MTIKKTVCDRCEKEVTGTHPPKLVSHKWSEERWSYRTEQNIHLCEECSKEFERFLKNER